jgi:RNA polymerase sigma-70 factor (ECF subfamily)
MDFDAAPSAFDRWVEMVDKIRSGDEAGVEELYAVLSSGICASLLRNADAQSAEDGLHEILLIVLEAIRTGELRDPARLMGFIRTVTRRRVVAQIRSAVFHRRRFAEAGGREPPAPLDQSPEARAQYRERVEDLMGMLDRLRARDREILERFYFSEQRPAQICGEMRLTETQFRLYKSRAIAKCFDLARRAASSRGARARAPGRSQSHRA